MKEEINYDEIKFLYEKLTKDTEKQNKPNKWKNLPAYITDWNAYFNEIEKKLWGDIRSIGIFLYPKYPIDKYFIAFGNPFIKIGINIEYNNQKFDDNLKIAKLKELGWTIYTIKSKNTLESAEDFYNRVNKSDVYFGEILTEERDSFIQENHLINSECLIYYLRTKYFGSDQEENVADQFNDEFS